MSTSKELNNPYVRDFYNQHLSSLEGSYTDSRWNASPAQKFDYRQTSRAIEHALGDKFYGSAIEVGPGDAVWTHKILKRVTGRLHLIEQSDEMLAQAKVKLQTEQRITYERSDFMESNPPKGADVLMAIRCFEYFSDKPASIKKMFALLAPKGRLVIVTKNADLYTTKNVRNRQVHSGQVTKKQMLNMLEDAGFILEAVYPAVLRWKIRYFVPRIIFDNLQKLAVASNGTFYIPWLFTKASESYCYVASKPK